MVRRRHRRQTGHPRRRQGCVIGGFDRVDRAVGGHRHDRERSSPRRRSAPPARGSPRFRHPAHLRHVAHPAIGEADDRAVDRESVAYVEARFRSRTALPHDGSMMGPLDGKTEAPAASAVAPPEAFDQSPHPADASIATAPPMETARKAPGIRPVRGCRRRRRRARRRGARESLRGAEAGAAEAVGVADAGRVGEGQKPRSKGTWAMRVPAGIGAVARTDHEAGRRRARRSPS